MPQILSKLLLHPPPQSQELFIAIWTHGFGDKLMSACPWAGDAGPAALLRRQGTGMDSREVRRRRRRRAAAMAERSLPSQLLSHGGTHGLVTFDISYTIF